MAKNEREREEEAVVKEDMGDNMANFARQGYGCDGPRVAVLEDAVTPTPGSWREDRRSPFKVLSPCLGGCCRGLRLATYSPIWERWD